MVAFKAAQVASLLSKPQSEFRAFLLYGPEVGLISDRAAELARKLVEQSEPAGEIIRLDDRDLAEDPARLAVETQTISMFAGQKVIRLKTGPLLKLEQLGELLDAGHEAWLVIEAGNLRPAAKLRKLFETTPAAAALPCYADGARDIARSIDQEAGRLGAPITAAARTMLLGLVGSDPAMARTEIQKLALYCGDGATIEAEHVEAIVADSCEVALDALVHAAAEKSRGRAVREFDRLAAAGQSPQSGLIALTRHFQRLHRLVAEIEAGAAPKNAVAAIRPPLGFKQRDALIRQTKLWPRPAVQHALGAMQEAIAQSRRRPQLERQIAERLVLGLCQ